MNERKLVVIDGHSLLYRAYHALPPLTSKKGQPVGAVYGFVNMLFTILDQLSPTHVAVAWDSPGPTFRHEMFEEYKGTRAATPEDFGPQKELTTQIVDAFGIVQIGVEGFEADDIIGSIATKGAAEGFTIIIATGDMDALQLVGEHVSVFAPVKGFSQTTLYEPNQVVEKFNGLTPAQIIDYKALRGDPSDNIPGVKGIGEKSAIELLLEYGTIEKVYENIDSVTPKFQQKLRDGRESAFLSKRLATIKTDMTLPVSINETEYGGFDPDALRKVFATYEFYSLAKKLPISNTSEPTGGTLFDVSSMKDAERVSSEEFDVKIAAHLLYGWVGGEVDLDVLAFKLLSTTTPVEDQMTSSDKNNVESALALVLRPEFEKSEHAQLKKLFHEVEMPLRKILLSMQSEGIRVDRQLLLELTQEYRYKIAENEKRAYDAVGYEFNLNSPKQLEEVLFDQLQLPVIKRTKTQRSTNESVLSKLSTMHPVVNYILSYRTSHKILSTYLEPLAQMLDRNDRVHTTFNQTKTASGRLSSENPNMQNIPADADLGIRKLFIPRDGNVFVVADYSQIELRILAHVTNDQGLITSFTHGQDIHSATAARIFGCLLTEVTPRQRQVGKTINFALLYGMTPYGLSEQLDIDTKEAKKYIDSFFSSYPGVVAWKDAHVKNAQALGYVETLYGRKRYLPGLSSRNNIQRSANERIAINHPIQGTQADIIKKAMVTISEKLNGKAQMLLQVHDELVCETSRNDAQEISRIMTEVMQSVVSLCVPLKVEAKIGVNWAECK
ncbi:hypothetical protein COY32_04155 [candidate division WWE3 bacterium CG_4_10_14_0_2_um_filter_41_14]|uniref:DNA-directed DNA polymerase n=1 Tax=candidate division WWE3 bacterium CG_4_10_14_0_2_um_filter_41_14 TaxID=1975072 RepID=A0A2M7TI38_UNCKA|nr:MAG: hypothetical protein COY32_04155 [candidate division WWE3 bacterium CG_4_10_14_0_2_um_filter_41_14]